MKRYIASFMSTIVFAHFYAVIERWFYNPDSAYFRDSPLNELPHIGVASPYHYLFMATLFLFIASLPFWTKFNLHDSLFIAGMVFMAAVIEDAAFFYIFNEWIRPDYWTASTGYISIMNVTIPTWYLLFSTLAAWGIHSSLLYERLTVRKEVSSR